MNRFFAMLVLIVSLLCVSSAIAHELVLKPSDMTVPKGETLSVELHSLHYFFVAEEVEDISIMEAGVFRNGALQKAELRENEPELRIDFDVKIEDDGAALIVANRVGRFSSVTNEGNKRGRRGELEAQGFRVVRTTNTDKFTKAIVNAVKGDEKFAAIVGQDLEIVPVTNPADAVVGEYFDVRILHDGQPVAIPVWATYGGFVLDIDDTYAYYTISDTDGLARIKITAPGTWIARTTTSEAGVEGEYDIRNLISIMTFEVK